MGIHYKVFCFDDHLGMLIHYGKVHSGPEEATLLNDRLQMDGATLFNRFVYSKEGNCLIGELRNSHPPRHKQCFSYDNVYYNQDNHGSVLQELE